VDPGAGSVAARRQTFRDWLPLTYVTPAALREAFMAPPHTFVTALGAIRICDANGSALATVRMTNIAVAGAGNSDFFRWTSFCVITFEWQMRR